MCVAGETGTRNDESEFGSSGLWALDLIVRDKKQLKNKKIIIKKEKRKKKQFMNEHCEENIQSGIKEK